MAYIYGSDSGTLSVSTGREGAVAKAGHDLRMDVTRWEARLNLDPPDPSLDLEADSTSFRVLEATGGIKALKDDEKASIPDTINEDVLKTMPIVFHSTRVVADGATLRVEGELTLRDGKAPIGFELALADDGHVTGSAQLKQTDWGIKPYSALFGTLKVSDVVVISVDANPRSE
jgi:polyisoprenoid-binding protein YceI